MILLGPILGGKKAWAGRYLAHLPTPIPFAQFTAPNPQQVVAFTAELTASTRCAIRIRPPGFVSTQAPARPER
jgi:hypothetical protein